jgi:hypothetical protein
MKQPWMMKFGFVVATATVFSACPLFQKGTGSGSGTGTSSSGGTWQEREAERGKKAWPGFVEARNAAKGLSPSADASTALEACNKFKKLIEMSKWMSIREYARTLPDEKAPGDHDLQKSVSDLFSETVSPWVKANIAKDPLKANSVLDYLYNQIKERPAMKEAADALVPPIEKIYASRVAARKYEVRWDFPYAQKARGRTSCYVSATKPGAAPGAIKPQVRFDSDISDVWIRCYLDKPAARLTGDFFNVFVGPYRLAKDQYVDQVKRSDMKLDGEARYVDMMVTMASITKTIEKAAKQALPFERMTLSLHTAQKTGGYTRQWDANARVYIDSPNYSYEDIGFARIELVQK